MVKIKRFIFIFCMCFICTLIPNTSFAATEWKDEGEFSIGVTDCTTHTAEACKIYTSGSKKIHIGNNGYNSASRRFVLDYDTGVLCVQFQTYAEKEEKYEKNISIQYKVSIDGNKVDVIPISKEAKTKIGENGLAIKKSQYGARVAYILSFMENTITSSNESTNIENRRVNGTQGAMWDIAPKFWSEIKVGSTKLEIRTSDYYETRFKGFIENKNATSIINKSEAYGNYMTSNPTAASKANTTLKISELDKTYYKIGPFKVKYSVNTFEEATFAGFKSASLKMGNNNVASSDWGFCDSKGNKISKPSNTEEEFYIKVKKTSIKNSGKLSINVKKMNVKADFLCYVKW